MAAEYQRRETEQASVGSVEHSSFAAAQGWIGLGDRLKARLEHQHTLRGQTNNQTTAGLNLRASPGLDLDATATRGSRGRSLQGGVTLDLGDGKVYLRERLVEDRAGRSTATLVGGERAIGTSSRVYSEYQWERAEDGGRQVSLVGMQNQWEVRRGLRLVVTGEHGEVDFQGATTSRYALSAGILYDEGKGLKAQVRGEVRRERGSPDRLQLLSANSVEMRLIRDFVLLANYRYSTTRDLDLDRTEAHFEERVLGLAYRPVNHDRFNALARYTNLLDERPQSLPSAPVEASRAHVGSVEWSWQLTRHLEWVEKEALKVKREQVDGRPWIRTRTYLGIHRLNLRLWRALDWGWEYRMLRQWEAQDRREGWLTEVMWEAVEHIRFGVGYNFTDFSDNEFSDQDYSVHGWFVRLQGKY